MKPVTSIIRAILILLAVSPLNALATSNELVDNANFSYNNRSFLLTGAPYQIIGGQMGPQRIPRAYWAPEVANGASNGPKHHLFIHILESPRATTREMGLQWPE
jgi:hypothetical protein